MEEKTPPPRIQKRLSPKTKTLQNMLVGIMGKMGAGKTLAQSILASAFSHKLKLPMYANYSLFNATRFNSLDELWDIEDGIICFDEIWLTMDARMWANNVTLTKWVNQTRKKRVLVLYTTQHIKQVEMRVRQGTDYLIYCKRVNGAFWWQFLDYQYGEMRRRYLLNNPQKYYSLYDTFEIVDAITLGGSKSGRCKDCGAQTPFPNAELCSGCYKKSKH